MNIAIVGCGIGGLTLALTLHRTGIDASIRVYEAVSEIKALGVGINMLPHAVRVLSELGLQDDLAAVAVEPKEFAYFTRHGQFVYSEPCGLYAGYPYPHFSVHRAALHAVLLEAACARLGPDLVITGHRCVDVTQSENRVTMAFVDDTGKPLPSQSADVVIACDGIHSAIRHSFYPDEGEPHFGGINMWRGVTRRSPFLSGGSITRIGGLSTSYKMLVYPIRNDIDETGNQLVNWVAEVISDRQLPVDWSKPGKLEDFFDYFDWKFDWLDVAALMKDADFVLSYPMVDREPLPQWTFERVTLLGDAAHPMYPRGGNGGAQSILDAECLARNLVSADPIAALRSYEAERRPVTSQIVLQNRTAPPDVIIDTVEERTGGKPFERLEDVIKPGELRSISENYERLAGYHLETLSGQPRG